MFRLLSLWALIFLCTFQAKAQHQELQEKPGIWTSAGTKSMDSTSLLSVIRAGKVSGHFRYFHSSTFNKSTLTDYHANAIGGGLRYETGVYKGFSGAVSGFYIFNAGSSDLAAKDPATGQANRYEIGLFDIADPSHLDEINRLEEFFIRYTKKGVKATFGRQLINTPFINLQDGRMRPTAAEGLAVEYVPNKKHQMFLAWIYSIAPRGTRSWYSLEKSVGLYPQGVLPSGIKSDYAGNTYSKGALMGNYRLVPGRGLTVNIWNLWVENIMNTALLQADWERKADGLTWVAGFQSAVQSRTGDGGNDDPVKAFYTNEKRVYTFGARTGIKNRKYSLLFNVNRVSGGGRYLMPREWGRDYFYTFMARERNEGFGDTWAWVLKSSVELTENTGVRLDVGYFSLPDVKNFALNKYGMPSYYQLNADVRHRFSGFFNGLEVQLLWVAKWRKGEIYEDNRYSINKVDMHLLNMVINYRF